MAVVLQEIVDSDFEYFVKITTTGTNSSASVFDASAAEGAATDPRTSITGVAWSVAATTDMIDILSNGFKFRIATDPNVAETYMYVAFAKAPFVNSNGVPNNAR